MFNNEILLLYYNKGFHDELYGTSTVMPDHDLVKKAYAIGAAHALVGDDVRSVDYLTNEEILELINKK